MPENAVYGAPSSADACFRASMQVYAECLRYARAVCLRAGAADEIKMFYARHMTRCCARAPDAPRLSLLIISKTEDALFCYCLRRRHEFILSLLICHMPATRERAMSAALRYAILMLSSRFAIFAS